MASRKGSNRIKSSTKKLPTKKKEYKNDSIPIDIYIGGLNADKTRKTANVKDLEERFLKPAMQDLMLAQQKDSQGQGQLIPEKTVNDLYDKSIDMLADETLRSNIFKDIQTVIDAMKLWLKEFELKKEIFEKQRYINNIYAMQVMNKKRIERYDVTKLYNDSQKSVKMTKSQKSTLEQYKTYYETHLQDLKASFLKGYKLWFTLRQILTQQQILYSVLYTGETTGNVCEAEMSLDEFLKRANFNLKYDVSDATKALSYKMTFDSLKDPLANIKENSKTTEEFSNPFYDFLLKKYGGKAINGQVIDRGAIYETYLEVKQSFGKLKDGSDFTDKLDYQQWWRAANTRSNFKYFKAGGKEKESYLKAHEIMSKWMNRTVLENKKDYSSGRVIGDQGLIQAKNITNASAQLSALQSLPTDIYKLINEYDAAGKNKNQLKQIFLKFFTLEYGQVRGENKNKTLLISDLTLEYNMAARMSIAEIFD